MEAGIGHAISGLLKLMAKSLSKASSRDGSGFAESKAVRGRDFLDTVGCSDIGFGLGDLGTAGDEPRWKVRGGEPALENEREDDVCDSKTEGKGDAADLGTDGTGLEVEGLRSELDI